MKYSFRLSAATVCCLSLMGMSVALFAPSNAAATNPGAIAKAPSVWLDASDPDGDGNASNNPADGADVSTWKDKSGNGNDATLLSGSVPAKFKTSNNSDFAGQTTLTFTRTSDTVGTRFAVPFDMRASTHPNVTVFAVYKPTVIAPNIGVWGSDNGDWDRFFLAYHPGFGDGINDGVAATGPTSIGITVTDAALLNRPRLSAVRYAGNFANNVNSGPTNASAVFFDGDLVARFTDNTDAWNAQNQLIIGADGDNSVFAGNIAEILVYPYALTDAEIRAVSTYIHDNYEIAKLPVSIGTENLNLLSGTEVNSIPFVTQPPTTLSDWQEPPVCNAYAKSDVSFETPLTGTLAKGKYNTHCSGGVSDDFATAEYLTGQLNIRERSGTTRATVFFSPYSAILSDTGKRTLNRLVAQTQGKTVLTIVVKGFVQPTKLTNNDAALSRQRAVVVATYLKKLMGPEIQIKTKAMGADSFNSPKARKSFVWLKFERQS